MGFINPEQRCLMMLFSPVALSGVDNVLILHQNMKFFIFTNCLIFLYIYILFFFTTYQKLESRYRECNWKLYTPKLYITTSSEKIQSPVVLLKPKLYKSIFTKYIFDTPIQFSPWQLSNFHIFLPKNAAVCCGKA